MTRRTDYWVALLLGALLCTTAQAQEELQKVRIASGGHVVHFLPLDLAVTLHLFKDEGLEPEITFLKGGTATAQALMSGQVDFSTNSIDHAFKAAAKGKDDLRMVVLLNQTPGMVLVVDTKHKSSIKSIADLRGTRLGVTSKGSATNMVLAFLLSRNGVSLDQVTVVKAGTSTFPPALKHGDIDGGIAIEPFASTMVEQGDAFVLQRLVTAEDSQKAFGGPYSLTGILTRQDMIDGSPELVRKTVRAHVRALKWMKDHTEEEIADILPSEIVGSDRDRYIRTLKHLRDFYSPNGALSREGARNVLAAMRLSGTLSTDFEVAPERYLNASFVASASRDTPREASTGADSSTTSPPRNVSFFVTVIAIALALLVVAVLAIRHHWRR